MKYNLGGVKYTQLGVTLSRLGLSRLFDIGIMDILSVVLNLSKYLSRRGELDDGSETPSQNSEGFPRSSLIPKSTFLLETLKVLLDKNFSEEVRDNR